MDNVHGGNNLHGKEIQAGEFKQHCLRLMDEVAASRMPLVVTKRGKAVVKLVPIEETSVSSYGALQGTVRILGDIVSPIDVEWEANA
jgi:prevent-host-death family protein